MSTKRRESAKGKRAEDGTVLCSCGCGQVPKPPRRSWFSDACVEAWKILNDPGHVRFLLRQRDKGICAACGCNADEEYRKYFKARNEVDDLVRWFEARLQYDLQFPKRSQSIEALWPEAVNAQKFGGFDWAKYRALRNAELDRLMGPNPGWTPGRSSGWDADHIVEVVNGGGQCGLENYQTLCHPCHKAKTKRLAAELAQRRRKPSPQPELVLA